MRHVCHHFNATIDDYLALQAKHEKLQRSHANIEIKNRLLCSEVEDINGNLNAIEDSMQDQYYESLELKVQNAELKERNAYLEKEVQRLRGVREGKTKTAESTPDAKNTKKMKSIPATYKPHGPFCDKLVFHYTESTVASRAKLSTPPSAKTPRKGHVSTASTSSASFSRNSGTGTVSRKKYIDKSSAPRPTTTPMRVSSTANAFPSSATPASDSTVKHNVRHKRTLSPQLRETLLRTISRSPPPSRVWTDIPDDLIDLRDEGDHKRSRNAKHAFVEDGGETQEMYARGKAKNAAIRPSAFV